MKHSKYTRDVDKFIKKFKQNKAPTIGFHDIEILKGKVRHLQEELNEISKAIENDDIAELLDGLVDLTYVTIGIALLCNLPFDEAWDLIHKSNMEKECVECVEESKRGIMYDVKKPKGWKSPGISELIYDKITDDFLRNWWRDYFNKK